MKVLKSAVLTVFLLSFLTFSALADGRKTPTPKSSGTPEPTEVTGPTYEPPVNQETLFEIDGTKQGDNVINFDVKTDKAGSVVLKVNNTCAFVDSVKVITNEPVNAQFKFESVKENPEKVVLDKPLGYCKVEVTNLDKSAVDSVEWTLRASRKQISELNYKMDSLSLVRFNNASWEKINTKRTDGNTDNYIYTAKSNNLESGSYGFAQVKSSLFTLPNILICLGALFGLIILGVIIAYSTQKSDNKKKTYKNV